MKKAVGSLPFSGALSAHPRVFLRVVGRLGRAAGNVHENGTFRIRVLVFAHQPNLFGRRPRRPGALKKEDRRGCLKAEAKMAALAGERFGRRGQRPLGETEAGGGWPGAPREGDIVRTTAIAAWAAPGTA